MSEENRPEEVEKVRRHHVALTDLSSQKIDNWLEQIRTKKKGVTISKKDFINWLIEKMPDVLPNADLNNIIEIFFDEEALLRQLLRDVKRAKKEGLSESTLELIVRSKKVEQKRTSNMALDSESPQTLPSQTSVDVY